MPAVACFVVVACAPKPATPPGQAARVMIADTSATLRALRQP